MFRYEGAIIRTTFSGDKSRNMARLDFEVGKVSWRSGSSKYRFQFGTSRFLCLNFSCYIGFLRSGRAGNGF